MPNGFSGYSVKRFFETTNHALEQAVNIHNNNPMQGMKGVISPRILNVRMPFTVDSALSGRYTTGVGRSSNIVVNPAVYENVIKNVNRVDDQSGADLYRLSVAIEKMCNNIFIVPETIPRIMAITGQIKKCLGQFRPIAEEVNITTRNFVRQMMEIDGGSSGSQAVTLAISEQGAAQARQSISKMREQQSSNMTSTQEVTSAAARDLRNRAQIERMREQEERNRLLNQNNQIFTNPFIN